MIHEPQVTLQHVESHRTLWLPYVSDKHLELLLAPREGVQPSKGVLSVGTDSAKQLRGLVVTAT